MPMYFPDLKSVQNLAKSMSKNTGDKKYKGICPHIEKDLSEARKQLGKYFREVWKDNIQAMEVELAVNEENYDKKMSLKINDDLQLQMDIRQGYVASQCYLDGILVMILVNSGKNPCDGCNLDKSICGRG